MLLRSSDGKRKKKGSSVSVAKKSQKPLLPGRDVLLIEPEIPIGIMQDAVW